METTRSIATILFNVSAYAEREGLSELGKKVADAATAALLEVPGATQDERLKSLARADVSELEIRQSA
jgi:hypothetical protein